MKELFFLSFLILFTFTVRPRCEPAKLPNIIIITISGVRNSETIDDKSHQYIPNLFDKMFKEGVLYTNLKPLKLEFHAPSQGSIISGVTYYQWPFCYTTPSFFTYAAKKYNLPKTKLWVLNGFFGYIDTLDYASSINYVFSPSDPELLKIFDTPQMKRFFGQSAVLNLYPWPHWDSNSSVMLDILFKVLNYHKPVIMHYIMAQTETAHYDTYARYVLSLKSADADLCKIWNYIDTDEHYKNNTYLIVSVDHPRDDNYMKHDRPRDNVWMYIYGPGIKRNVRIVREVRHIDIFATVAYLLDIETHKTEGKVLFDSFSKNFKARDQSNKKSGI
jgi:hypothetical protein